jgi:lipid II:glycine glycyltransferase (peptidoglycan interpeptide bridge formation enzyme)
MACYPTFLYHVASRIISINPSENQLMGRAVKLLVWEAVKLAKLKGYQEPNFGGISEEMTGGINFFKLRYGAKPRVQYTCEKANNLLLKILPYGKGAG